MDKESNFEEQFNNMYENCLFRYRSFNEMNLSSLEDDRLYFSSPVNFNDPYDNLMFVNLGELLSDIATYLNYDMDDYLESLKGRNAKFATSFSDKWYGSEKEKTLNDYYQEIIHSVDRIRKYVRTFSKVICFSEVYDSMLMWSHYANYHKGYSLIYDKKDLKRAERYAANDSKINDEIRLKKVMYVSSQIDLTEDIRDYVRFECMDNLGDVETPDGSIPVFKLQQSITEKSKEWSYEKEWRLILSDMNIMAPSPLKYIKCIPKGIILGAHCNQEDSEKLISICRRKNIPIYRMYLDERDPAFKLNINLDEKVKLI